MLYIFKNAQVFLKNHFSRATVVVENGIIRAIANNDSSISNFLNVTHAHIIDCSLYHLFPGFADVHVHFREPGFSYKETIKTGSACAARGGYTTVSTMPNLNPVPDDLAHLQTQLDIINRDSCIDIVPYGAITVGELGEKLADISSLAPYVVAFSDDGKGIQDPNMMLQAMTTAQKLHKIIAAHCEDNSLLHAGYIHDGNYAKTHQHRGISSESEWRQIERDLQLAEQSGCAYHICHISTKESVELIRQAKARGVDVTCETAPHYLVMTEDDLQEDGRFKMNPPLRAQSDRQALIGGIIDGTIDMIATDHAPHTLAEKSLGLAKSAMGIVGLETAFPILYTYLVQKGIITPEKLIELMSINPQKRFYEPFFQKELTVGAKADFCLFDLNQSYTVEPDNFLSMGRSTPFSGWTVTGKCLLTIANGHIAYQDNDFKLPKED